MTILLTGANGFVGGAILYEASLRGLTVLPVFRTAESALAMGNPYGHVVQPSLDADTDWRKALAGVDVVIHCAARTHVMNERVQDPLTLYRSVNVAGTLNLARQAAAAGVRRFLFMSSIKVNGEGTKPGEAYTADDVPAPVDAYGISKAEAEAGLREISAKTGMEITVIRPVLVYGTGVKGNFQSMVNLVKKGIPLPLGCVTKNRRSVVALDNLVDLTLLCLDHPAAANEIFLVSDDEDVSSAVLFRRIGRALGKKPRLFPVPGWGLLLIASVLGRREVANRLLGSLQVDISKTRELLGWAPRCSMDEGLKKVGGRTL